ncbi:hypothetical protein [Methylobacterium trifolii]|uniref:Uncharacterized protein n=1 Tax=Methylobacterium trifolii TaxID=1003092 RepID=A0ABQ4U516_9HYPH|nr:hypothetical protein [Methylobacterium trifolii]GJE62515.1 hypothetical protein MPOCJGCO_4648 [Methylobacterium trifolii]
MLRLHTAEDLGQAGSLASQRGIAAYDLSPLARGDAAIADGIEKIGGASLGLGLGIIKERKDEEVYGKARADVAFIPDHIDLLSKQRDAPYGPTYEAESQCLLKEAAANIKDDRAHDLWMMDRAGSLANGLATVKGLADRQAGDLEVADIRRAEDAGVHAVAQATNEADREAMIRSVGARWDEAASKGYVTAAERAVAAVAPQHAARNDALD